MTGECENCGYIEGNKWCCYKCDSCKKLFKNDDLENEEWWTEISGYCCYCLNSICIDCNIDISSSSVAERTGYEMICLKCIQKLVEMTEKYEMVIKN